MENATESLDVLGRLEQESRRGAASLVLNSADDRSGVYPLDTLAIQSPHYATRDDGRSRGARRGRLPDEDASAARRRSSRV